MTLINRDALMLIPLEPALEWTRSVFPGELMDEEVQDPLANDNLTIYLIPEFDSEKAFQTWLRKNYLELFEDFLIDWCTDDTEWPEDLSYKQFKRFFRISYQTMVDDFVPGKSIKHDQL